MKRLLLLAGGLAVGLGLLLVLRSSIEVTPPEDVPSPAPAVDPESPSPVPAPEPSGEEAKSHTPGTGALIRVTATRADGHPARFASVSVHPLPDESGALPEAVLWQEADADGACAIGAVPPGDWLVRAELAGWAAASLPVEGLGGGESREVVLRLGYGRRLAGRVVARDGAPIPDARVTAGPAGLLVGAVKTYSPRTSCMLPLRASAMSDHRGEYSIAELPEGLYDVRAVAEGFLPASVRAIRPTRDGVDLILYRSYEVKVRVGWDGEEAPAEIEVVTDAGAVAAHERNEEGVSHFLFAGLPAGDHRVTARASGFCADRGKTTVGPARPPGEVSLLLRRGTRVSGKVTERFTGRTVPYAEVAFLRWAQEADPETVERLRVKADGEGRYETVVGQGLWILRPSKEGFLLEAPQRRRRGRTPPPGQAVRVGTASVEQDLVLQKDFAAVGRVISRDGRPIAKLAVVYVTKKEPLTDAPGPVHPHVRPVRTDERGHYRLSGLLPTHKYIVCARAGEDNVDQAEGVRIPDGKYEVRLRDLVLHWPAPLEPTEGRPPATVRGRVVDLQGEPVPGANVTALHRTGRTDANGAFEVSGHYLMGSSPPLRVLAAGHPPVSFEPPRTYPGRATDIGKLVLPDRGTVVSGTVTDAEGRGVPGAVVTIEFAGTGIVLREPIDEAGEFEVEGPVPIRGQHVAVYLDVRAPGYLRARAYAQLYDREHFRIRMTALAVLTGRLEFPGEAPPWVDLVVQAQGEVRHPLALDPAGRFTLELSPWYSRVRLEAPGHIPEEILRPNLRPGRVRDLGNVRLRLGGTIVVRVVDHAGRPLAGETVRIRPPHRVRGRWMRPPSITDRKSDREGVVRFEHLVPGDYSVTVRPTWRPARASGEVVNEKVLSLTVKLE